MDLNDLEPPWLTVFDLMWEAYVAGTIPVGAVVANERGEIVSRGRNRIFSEPAEGQLARTRLAHAEINALMSLSSERQYPDLTLYTTLEPCPLCLAATSSVRLGTVRYAGAEPYSGAVGRQVPTEDLRVHPLRIEGPLPDKLGRLSELLHLRHMLWRVPDGPGIVPYYRQHYPEAVELASRLPAPPEATSLADAYTRMEAP